MGAINRVPAGLLSLLDGQNLGDNPGEIADVISPTIDLWHFFLASKGLEQVVAQEVIGPASPAGPYAVLTVPVGELWVIEITQFLYQSAAAGSIAGYPAIRPAIGLGWCPCVDGVLTGTLPMGVLPVQNVRAGRLPNELLLPSGGQIATYALDCATLAAGITTLSTIALIQRLRI
jgi:hypothetical protein